MADVLKVTTPTTGYENSTRTNPINVNDKNIQNIVDPTKVIRPDGKTDFQDNADKGFKLNYESNFDKFIQLMKDTPEMMEIFTELLFAKMGIIINSGINENFADEISQFMEMLKMNESELFNFVKSMSATSVKFKGAFFNILREVLQNTTSIDLKADILSFLKRYNDMSSGDHILNSIMNNLKDISDYMLKSFKGAYQDMIDKLDANAQNGDIKQNSAILKEEIIPYLSNYISRTHDLGKVRDVITLLTLNIARYENGDKEALEQAFKELMGYNGIRERFGDVSEKKLFDILMNTDFQKNSSKMSLVDKLTDIIKRGMNSEAGFEMKAVFEGIVKSILVNESVYMPLLHMMIPADIDGRLFFSELWIDPDSENSSGGGQENERVIKLLIKFDIKDLGFFDLIMTYDKNGNADMQLYYPEKMYPLEKTIRSGLTNIMERNGITFKSLFLDKCIKPKSLTEVFPQIYERKNAINVSV